MRIPLKKHLGFVLYIAFLSGIVRVIIDYIPRILDISPIAYYSTFFISFILEILIIIYVTKKFRNSKSNLTVIDALRIGIIIMTVIGLLYCSSAYIYDIYIDPEFQTNMTLRFTEQFSPDQLDQVKENIQNQDTSKSYLGVIMYTIWFVFLGAIISLIVGSVLKTKEELK